MSWSIAITVPSSESSENGIYSVAFRNYIAAMKNVILAQSTNQTHSLSGVMAVKYTGDFGGWLLLEYKIPIKYHWIIAWINGITDSTAYDGTEGEYVIPDTSYIDSLVSKFTTETSSTS